MNNRSDQQPALGINGISSMVERHCRCAALLKQEIADIDGVRVLNDVCLNQIAITFNDSNLVPMHLQLTITTTTNTGFRYS